MKSKNDDNNNSLYRYTLLVSSKRQNGWTDRAQFFKVTHMTPGKIFLNFGVSKSINIW